MDAGAKLLLGDFLNKSGQFVIPVYQRTYSWQKKHCEQLFNDIEELKGSPDNHSHFVGSVIYIEQENQLHSNIKRYLVIDGQQRLTTLTLLIIALARRLEQFEELPTPPHFPITAENLRNYFLINQNEKEENRFRLLLTKTDKSSLKALIEGKPYEESDSIRISENIAFFSQKLADLSIEDCESLWEGMHKLRFVEISLDRTTDEPQKIFENMNFAGHNLTQSDLIRNFILMDLGIDEQVKLYEDYWHSMEMMFGQEGYVKHFDSFIRDFLISITFYIPSMSKLYEAFQKYCKGKTKEEVLIELHRYAKYYCAFALGQESNDDLKKAFIDLRGSRETVFYPLVLRLYESYRNGNLTVREFEQAIRTIESYVFRRTLCDIPTNILNGIFASFRIDVETDTESEVSNRRVISNFIEGFQKLVDPTESKRGRFPQDEEVSVALLSRNVFKMKHKQYLFARLENHTHEKEPILEGDYQVEHIMPQTLTQRWKEDLGEDWQSIHDRMLNVLGNLTLTGYNPEYSNRPFLEKRDLNQGEQEIGYKHSPLSLNREIGQQEAWTSAQIEQRTKTLTDRVLKCWPLVS